MNPPRLALWGLLMIGPIVRAEPPSTTDLTQRLPESANVVAVVQVGEILKSPVAIRGNWAQPGRTIYLAGTIPINPNVQRIVIGSHFDPDHPGHTWHLAMLSLTGAAELDKLAEAHKGRLEMMGDLPVARVEPYGYVARLQDNLLAVGSAERQNIARWLQFAVDPMRTPRVSPYLVEAASRHATNHVLVAINTQDLIEPAGVRAALLTSKLIDDERTRDRAARFLQRLRGLRLVIQLGDEIRATAHFDSAEPARGLEVLKPFLVEVFDRAGAQLEDLTAATVRADGPTLSLQFRLTDTDLNRVLGVVSSPLLHPDPSVVSNINLTPDGVNGQATHRYYYTVNKLLEDLRRRSRRADDYHKTALWHETAARKIETTSVLHVDKDAVAYAVDAALKMRAIADSLRGVPITLVRLEAMKQLYVTGMPIGGWRGGWSFIPWVETNIPQVEAKQLEAIRRDADNRQAVWESIDENRRSVSAALSRRYQIDFESEPK